MSENGQYYVTDVADWRSQRRSGELYELPSGMVVRLRRTHILDLAEQGKIPDGLAGLAAELVGAGLSRMTLDAMRHYIDVVNLVVKAAILEPAIGDEGTNEQLAVGEVEMTDRLAIFNYCNASRKLRKFRPPEEEPVDAA